MPVPLIFYVHRNSTNQPLYNNQYNRILFTNADFDDGALFNFSQSRWIAPQAGRINLAAQAFIATDLLLNNNTNLTIKFILNSSPGLLPPSIPNGADIFAPIGAPIYPITTGIGVAGGSGWWKVNTGDAIELAVFSRSSTGGHSVVLDGHRAHTYWSGAFFPE